MNAALVVIDFTVKQRAPVAYVQSMATWEYFLLLVDLCLGAGQTLDTPRGLTPDGCSGDAHRAPARSRLKGQLGPLWSVDRIARRARRSTHAGSRAAPRVHHTGRRFSTGPMACGTTNQQAWIGAGRVSSSGLLTPSEAEGQGAGGQGASRPRLTAGG